MRQRFALCALSAALLLGGCQAVNTTSGDSVGVERKQYMFSMLSTDEVNQMYATSYKETVGEASTKGVLDTTSADAKRVHAIADRLIGQAPKLRPDSAQWQWEVNLIKSDELNANCGPGGKIIFYSGKEVVTVTKSVSSELLLSRLKPAPCHTSPCTHPGTIVSPG